MCPQGSRSAVCATVRAAASAVHAYWSVMERLWRKLETNKPLQRDGFALTVLRRSTPRRYIYFCDLPVCEADPLHLLHLSEATGCFPELQVPSPVSLSIEGMQGWICNSSICLKLRGMKPTGIAIFEAQKRGFRSVGHLLQVSLPFSQRTMNGI